MATVSHVTVWRRERGFYPILTAYGKLYSRIHWFILTKLKVPCEKKTKKWGEWVEAEGNGATKEDFYYRAIELQSRL